MGKVNITNSMDIKRLSNGIASIASCLDRKEKVFFMHSTNIIKKNNLNNFCGFYKELDCPSSSSHILSYVSKTEGERNFFGIVLYVNKHLANYLDKKGIAPIDNYIVLIDDIDGRSSSDFSLPASLIKNRRKLKIIRDSLIVSSFNSNDEIKASYLLGSELLSGIESCIFNSKIFFRRNAGDYKVSEGVEVVSSGDFPLLDDFIRSVNFSKETRIWVKSDFGSGGNGIKIIENKDDLYIIDEFKRKLEGDEVYGFCVEIDDSCRSNNSYLKSLCVNGFIGDSIGIFGVAEQLLDEKSYIGSKIDKCDTSLYRGAIDAVAPVFSCFKSMGYKGYLGVDVVCYNAGDNSLNFTCIESNARFNGSTALLTILHLCEDRSGLGLSGKTLKIKLISDSLEKAIELFDDISIDLNKSIFTGVVLFFIDDSCLSKGFLYLNFAIIYHDNKGCEKIEEDLKSLLDDFTIK